MSVSRCLLVAALVVSPALAVTPQAAAASAPTCHGERATLVGKPRIQRLSGTRGRDVVATNGSLQVFTFRGNDLICVSGGSPVTVVRAGGGDDVVDTSASTADALVQLEAGRDRYVGGRGNDLVFARGGGDDVVDTGGGLDIVDAGALRPRGTAHDVVRLGRGDDAASTTGLGSRVEGGRGRDSLFAAAGRRGQTTVYDAARGRASAGGRRVVQWSGIEVYGLSVAADPVRFVGTRRRDVVSTEVYRGARPGAEVAVEVGGGDDLVVADPRLRLSVDGGADRDRLQLLDSEDDETDDLLVVDLAEEVLHYARPGAPNGGGRVRGIEDVAVNRFTTSRLTGDAGPNRLTSYASCTTTLSGRGGDDVLLGLAPSSQGCGSATLRGGPGDDRMTGGGGDDTLVGYGGDDSADGRGGVDHCVAERIRRCEARL